jgi:hypothetical protein
MWNTADGNHSYSPENCSSIVREVLASPSIILLEGAVREKYAIIF